MNEVIELQSQDVPEDTTYMYDHQTDEAFFPVASTPVLDEDGQPTGYQRIKRTDTDKTVAIPKMVYTIIPYQKKVDILKETVRNSESIDITDMTETIRTSHEGRRLFVGINLPAEHQRIGYKDDGVNLSINLWDSYDRSCSLIVKAGCYRAKCSNGMLIGETISGIHKRHTGEFDEEKLREEIFAGTLTAIDAWKMERDNFELWNDTPISEGDAYKSLLKFTDKQTTQDRLFAQFREESDYSDATVWDFMNTLTSWATHTKARKKGNDLDSRKDRQLAVLAFRNSKQFENLLPV